MGADDEAINIIFNYRQYEFDSCKELVRGWFNCRLVSILMNGWKRISRTGYMLKMLTYYIILYVVFSDGDEVWDFWSM